MTSPQKKRFFLQLSAHGKEITKKAKHTLKEVEQVRAEMRAVLLNSEKISRHYSSTLQRIEDEAEKEREKNSRKRLCTGFVMVEPNLTRRTEEKKIKKQTELHKRS